MSKFDPPRSELRLRLIFSLIGLALVAGALVYRGIPTTASGWEAIGIAVLFFVGTLIWTLRKLARRDD